MALLILTSNESVGVSSGTYTVVGTRDGKETVTVAPGAKVTLDASFNAGGDSISVSGNAGSYKAVADGTQVILTDALGGTVTIPVGTTKSTVVFADASRDLLISGGALKLGNDTVGATSTTVTAGTGGTTPVAGQTFTLTTGANSIVGTSGDDFIDGSLGGAGGSTATLNSFDTINGGAGTDTLFATVTGSTTSPRITGVEALTFGASSATAASATIDLLNASGYTSVENNSSNIPLTIQNISTSAVSAKISNTQSNSTFSWIASAVNGNSDSVTLTLSNVTASGSTAPTVTINSIETVNVVVADAPSVVSMANVAANRVNLTGGQNVSVGTLNPLTNYLDASQFTANVTATTDAVAAATLVGGTGNDVLTVSAVTGNVSVSAGGGDDTIIAALNLTLTDTIDGGSGSADVLQTTNSLLAVVDAATPTTYIITNIERLTVTDTFSGTAPIANVATGINTVSLTRTDGALTSGTATFQGPSAFTLNLGATTTSGTNSGSLGGPLVVNSTGSGASDSLTINNLAVQTSTAVNVFGSNTLSTGGTSSGVTIPAYENITINTGTATTTATEAIGAVSITPDAAASAVSLTLTGANPVTVASVTTTSTGTFTVSAAGMTAASSGQTAVIGTISTATGGRSSVTGSGGNDTITVGGASTVDGGAGNDSITGSSAADSIVGNTGNDTLIGGGGNDTISGGTGTDRIDVSGGGSVSVSGGDGNDTFVFAGTLTSADTVDGGDGVDTISVEASTTVTSTAFSNVTSVEQVALTGTTSISLAAPLSSAGTTFDLSATTAQNITFATGYTGSVSVIETNGTAPGNSGAIDVINNTANVALTVSGRLADVNNIQVVGGTGIDALVLTADSTSATLANSSSIDTITMVAGTVTGNTTGSATATLTNLTSATGRTLAVDATALTNSFAAFSISGASSQLGGVSVTSGAGNDTINLSNFAGGSTVIGGAGLDTIQAGSGNDSLDGGAGSDTYVMGSNLNASDVIADASGAADVLSATINGLASATTGALRISGVETLHLSTSGAPSTINAAAITGATRINIGNGTEAQSVTLTNLAAGTNLGLGFTSPNTSISANTAYGGTLTFGLADSSGSADAVSVALNNVGSTANAISATLAAASGIESVTINASASTVSGATGTDARLTVSGLVVPSLIISGGGSTLTGNVIDLRGSGTALLSTSTTSVNASGLSASLRLNASASATQVTISGAGTTDTITGGAGNDSFTITSAGTTGYTISGGVTGTAGGVDSLSMTLATPASGTTSTTLNLANVTAIETFNIAIPSSIAVSTDVNVGGLNTVDAVSATFTGGNSLSSLTINTAIGTNSGWKSFDASALSGVVDVVVSPAVFGPGDTVRGGSGASDVLRVTAGSNANGSLIASGTATTTAPTISGWETLVVTTNDDAGSQSFANTTGLTTIAVAGTNSYTASGLAAGIAINLGTLASGNTTDRTFPDNKTLTATLATTTGTADSQTINLVNLATVSSGITLALDGIENINLNMSSTVAGPAASLAITDTNTNSVNINLSGGVAGTNRDLTFRSGGIQANVATINASSFVDGGMVMADGSRVGATAMTITGGSGNDTIIMKAAADVLTGGAGTDTLKITGSGVIGGYAIDLNSTTDQVVQYAGFANAAAQTGFENVDLAGVLGSFGGDITGRATAASSIVGTLNADNIVAGSGSDTITGGAGNDVINVGSAGTDRLVYSATSQTAGISSVTTANQSGQELSVALADVVTGMGRGDQIQFTFGSLATAAANTTTFGLRGTNSLLTDTTGSNTYALVQGTYLSSTGVFSVGSTGADMLLQWDTNGPSTSGGVEAVVLIGANSGTSNITGIISSTAGILTLV